VAPSGVPVQLASAPVEATTAEGSLRIGKNELVRAREVLSRARNELAPHQSRLLDGKLAEAERAFERFNRVARASGRVAEVARGAEGVRVGELGERRGVGLGAGRTAGPWLLLLVLLWPAETAGPEDDREPEWLVAKLEFEDKLREVSRAAQQVQEELTAARQGQPVEATRRDRPPKPNKVVIRDKNWKPAPGESAQPPCRHRGTGGDGPFGGETRMAAMHVRLWKVPGGAQRRVGHIHRRL
jgi:hypothetical protein